jgi:hypothetical protein
MTVFWDVEPCSLLEVYRRFRRALTMEAANTSGTSVNFYQTTLRNIPEDTHLHTRRRENLKSHLYIFFGRPRYLRPSDLFSNASFVIQNIFILSHV